MAADVSRLHSPAPFPSEIWADLRPLLREWSSLAGSSGLRVLKAWRRAPGCGGQFAWLLAWAGALQARPLRGRAGFAAPPVRTDVHAPWDSPSDGSWRQVIAGSHRPSPFQYARRNGECRSGFGCRWIWPGRISHGSTLGSSWIKRGATKAQFRLALPQAGSRLRRVSHDAPARRSISRYLDLVLFRRASRTWHVQISGQPKVIHRSMTACLRIQRERGSPSGIQTHPHNPAEPNDSKACESGWYTCPSKPPDDISMLEDQRSEPMNCWWDQQVVQLDRALPCSKLSGECPALACRNLRMA